MENFIAKLNAYFSGAGEGARTVLRALDFAVAAHAGQKRESGEDYIRHPVQVAEILLDLGMDADALCAALLHDVVEDTGVTCERIREEFGGTVAELVNGLTKLNEIKVKTAAERQAENFRKMFFAMTKDIRVLVIKLADRLHNMRTLSYLSRERQIAIAEETRDLYAPLAARLGVSYLKCELEDLCLKTLSPGLYEEIARSVRLHRAQRREKVDGIILQIRNILLDTGVKGEVSGRNKHLYSIYRKMTERNKSFSEIYDLTAIRVVVGTVDECYEVLGRIHMVWAPIPGRIKDYIAMPKPNNYQSLHTTVMTSVGMPFEIQIRTEDMHRVAEYGIAAHWKYKERREGDAQLNSKLQWLRQALDDSRDATADELLEAFKIDLYSGFIFTFTPKGDVIILPEGACPVDFAYKIHVDIGNKCTGARINGKLSALDTRLKTGDYVEILFNPNAKGGPKRDWLNICASGSAKSRIRAYLRKEEEKARAADKPKPPRAGAERTAPRTRPPTVFVITASDSKALLARILAVISEDLKLSVKTVTATEKNKQATVTLGILLRPGMDTEELVRRIKQIKGVKTVFAKKTA
jgi:GTP pyrophosphokinase